MLGKHGVEKEDEKNELAVLLALYIHIILDL
jgi:hypothetical protein